MTLIDRIYMMGRAEKMVWATALGLGAYLIHRSWGNQIEDYSSIAYQGLHHAYNYVAGLCARLL